VIFCEGFLRVLHTFEPLSTHFFELWLELLPWLLVDVPCVLGATQELLCKVRMRSSLSFSYISCCVSTLILTSSILLFGGVKEQVVIRALVGTSGSHTPWNRLIGEFPSNGCEPHLGLKSRVK
jgi:hypothetical protein